jgi:hypothetical protein
MLKPRENKAVAICPGPNLAYFKNIFSLDEMVKHIYGKIDILNSPQRPHIFLKELDLYINYLQTDIQNHVKDLTDKKRKQLTKFKDQLQEGINYYKQLFNELPAQATGYVQEALLRFELDLNATAIA